MVKRDDGPPKLCFDNPVYNDDEGAPLPDPPKQHHHPQEGEEEKQGRQDTTAKDTVQAQRHPLTANIDTRPSSVFPGLRNLAATKSLGNELLTRNSSLRSNTSFSSDMFSPAIALTPEVEVEERILEYKRNQDFWSRRSRNNPFRRESGASISGTIPKGSSSVPVGKTLSVPSQHELEVDVPFEGAIEEECQDAEVSASEGTLEILRERRLREDIAWMRNCFIEDTENNGGNFSQSSFLTTMKKKELLRRWFSLYDLEGDGILNQEEWIEQIKVSASELGAREWAELLEVLALVVCGEDAEVTEDLFTKILTSRGVLEKLFRIINKNSDGNLVSRQEIMDFIANLTYARPRTGFTRENLEWLEQLFRQALGHKQELSFDDFKKIVHSRNSFFAERVFQIFDRDNSGTVSLSEFLDAMHQFAGKSPNDKIKFLFRVYDLDGDGLIQQSELQKVMKACMEENGMKFSDEQIEDLTLALFEDADTQKQGAISYESLKAQLEKHNGLLENLSISIDRWLVPPNLGNKSETLKHRISKLKPYQMSLPYMKNNYVYLSFLLVYISVNLGLFISRAVQFWEDNNIFYIIARACGQCLNFNCMFVLVLMLRQCITYLRSMGASAFLPLDQHLYLHKLCGWVIFIFSFVHTLMHLINLPLYIVTDPDFNEGNYTIIEWLFTMKPEHFGLIHGLANPTGVALMIILTLMVICSQPFVRKSGYFEVFYWTHLLYIVFFILTIFHGPNFWKWFVAPGIIFLIERIHRTIRMRTGRGKTYISSGVLLPSKVIHLAIKRPFNFHFHPGDYVFVNLPAIAKYEWHPFTISSAPEQDEEIWLHIRAVGEWTNRLYHYFENEQEKCEKQRSHVQKNGQSCSVIMHDGNAIALRVDDARDIKNRPVTTRISLAPQMTAISESSPSDKVSNSVVSRKNGITNHAFEPDSNGNTVDKDEDESNASGRDATPRDPKALVTEDTSSTPVGTPDSDLARKRLAKSQSVPELDKSLKRKRPSSVKYIRRKPKVITLDIPSDEELTDSEGETKELTNDGEEQDTIIPETTLSVSSSTVKDSSALAVEEGRVRKMSQQELKQRRISRQEERHMRRKSRREEIIAEGGCAVGKPLVIYMDGPFGAPSSHIFHAQHAVLIATGIGVTPFASILQSIMHKYWKARHTCPKCTHSWTSDLPKTVMNLKKVDFFWINRDQRSFEWFVNLLSQLEIEQAEQGGVLERFLDMHMYITSALQKTDMKAVGLQLALDLLHEKEKRDLITGLKTRTNAGRPNWDKVFKQLQNQQKGKITVFYCGPPALARTLRYKCDEYGFDFRKEIF